MNDEGDGPDAPPAYRLRLFVAGSTIRSRRAIENLRRLCTAALPDGVDLAVIDIYQQPALAERYQVIAAPTLLKLLPLPERRIIGDLSETGRVLQALGLDALNPEQNGNDPVA